MFFCSLKLNVVICTSLCRLLGVWRGEALFKVSITRGIVVVFFVRIGAVLLLQNASFRTFRLFPSNSVLFFFEWLYLLSTVDSLVVLIVWNQVLLSRDEILPALLSRECCLWALNMSLPCTKMSARLWLLVTETCSKIYIIEYTAWFKKMDSISYVYISWTIYGMWMIYITFEREGPKFSNNTARALA